MRQQGGITKRTKEIKEEQDSQNLKVRLSSIMCELKHERSGLCSDLKVSHDPMAHDR